VEVVKHGGGNGERSWHRDGDRRWRSNHLRDSWRLHGVRARRGHP
jgi:hypothetical protein